MKTANHTDIRAKRKGVVGRLATYNLDGGKTRSTV